jgi:hypothetical protein
MQTSANWFPFNWYTKTLQKGRKNGGGNAGGWTGLGRSGAKTAFYTLVISLIVITISVGLFTGFFAAIGSYLNIFGGNKPGPGGSGILTPVTSQTPPTAPGSAWCSGTIYSTSGSYPNTCFATPVKLALTLQNVYGTTAFGASWGIRILSGGPGPSTSAPFGQQIDSCISSSGVCTSGSSYLPGQPLILELCDQATTCSSSSFAAQKTVAYYWLPTPSGSTSGMGNTPFCQSNNGCGSSTTAVSINLNMIFNSGDGFTGQPTGTNTPYVFSLQFPNGTTLGGAAGTPQTCPSSNTVYVNLAKGTQPCYLGSGVTKPTFVLTLTVPATATTPWGEGVVSFIEADLAYKGILSSGITMENSVSAGTVSLLSSAFISGSGTPFTKVYNKPASTVDFLSTALPSDGTCTVAYNTGTTLVSGTSNTFSLNFQIDATGLTAGATDTITFNFYFWFSSSYYNANGIINSPEAITEASTFTLTLHN